MLGFELRGGGIRTGMILMRAINVNSNELETSEREYQTFYWEKEKYLMIILANKHLNTFYIANTHNKVYTSIDQCFQFC